MRVLVVAPRMPEFDIDSGSRRLFHLLEFLRADDWSVSFVAHDATNGQRYSQVLRRMGVCCYAGPVTWPQGSDYLERPEELIGAGGFDLAILSHWQIGEIYLPLIRRLSPRTRVLVDSVDLHFLRQSRDIFQSDRGPRAGNTLGAAYADEFRRELNVYAAADRVLTVSEKEAGLVNDLVGSSAHACMVPDMEDVSQSPFGFAERRGLVFAGNFRHAPNARGVEYLCKDVLPRVDPALLRRHPVYLVGSYLDEAIANYGWNESYLRPVGWVPSLAPYLDRVTVSVLPLLFGAGTKRKLIQAAMTGTPSVSTSIGAEGLGVRDELEILIAEGPAKFALSIERLLADEVVWCRIASGARERILASHGSEGFRSRLVAALASVGRASASDSC